MNQFREWVGMTMHIFLLLAPTHAQPRMTLSETGRINQDRVLIDTQYVQYIEVEAFFDLLCYCSFLPKQKHAHVSTTVRATVRLIRATVLFTVHVQVLICDSRCLTLVSHYSD
jgi:hypothetical protein